MKVNIKRIRKMDMELSNGRLVIFILDSIKMMRDTDTEK